MKKLLNLKLHSASNEDFILYSHPEKPTVYEVQFDDNGFNGVINITYNFGANNESWEELKDDSAYVYLVKNALHDYKRMFIKPLEVEVSISDDIVTYDMSKYEEQGDTGELQMALGLVKKDISYGHITVKLVDHLTGENYLFNYSEKSGVSMILKADRNESFKGVWEEVSEIDVKEIVKKEVERLLDSKIKF